jgi:alkylation response protein AidB-like acyl-CoA dehydrogenase
VPKFIVNADGNRWAQRNGVVLRLLEEKMGIHGNATCVMNYDGATAISRRREQGPRAMFVMMNEARLGVGLQGLSQSESPIRTRRLREGPPAGPLAHRREGAEKAPPTRSSSTPTCAAC